MNHPFRILSLFALTALAAPSLPGQTLADQFARQQDFSTSPPTLDSYLSHIAWYVQPNSSYDHTGGPPFPSPGPWYLPAGLWSYHCHCKSGSYQSSSSPRCISTWSETYVTLTFTDGSRYSFEDTTTSTTCSDGSSDSFRKMYQVSELGPPGQRDWLVRVQSWAQETLETRRHSLRGRAGVAAAFPAQGGVPIVSGGPFVIEMAPGAVLDLRQNPAAAGPLFVTDGPVLLRCDTILMDPGVTLTELFSHPPIVQPGAVVSELAVPAASFVSHRAATPFHVQTNVRNLGNGPAMVQVSWNGPHSGPGQMTVNVPMAGTQPVAIPCQFPAGAPAGTASTVLVQATNLANPTIFATGEVQVSKQHPGVFVFGTGTAGCLGAHGTDISGPLAPGGPAAVLTVSGNNPNGVGLWAFGTSVGGIYGTLPLPGGVDLHVDPFGAWFATELYVAAASGVGSLPLQVPNVQNLRGLRLDCQPIGLWLGPCSPGVLSFSSGPALGLEVQ